MSVPSPPSSSPFPDQTAVHIGLSDVQKQEPFLDFKKEILLENGQILQFQSKDLSSVLKKKKLDLTFDGQSYTVHIGDGTPLFRQLETLSKNPNDAPVAKALLYKNAVAMLAVMGQAKKLTVTFKGNHCDTILVGNQELHQNELFKLSTKKTDGFTEGLVGTNYQGGKKMRLVTLQITYLSSDEKIENIRKKFSKIAPPSPTPLPSSSELPKTTHEESQEEINERAISEEDDAISTDDLEEEFSRSFETDDHAYEADSEGEYRSRHRRVTSRANGEGYSETRFESNLDSDSSSTRSRTSSTATSTSTSNGGDDDLPEVENADSIPDTSPLEEPVSAERTAQVARREEDDLSEIENADSIPDASPLEEPVSAERTAQVARRVNRYIGPLIPLAIGLIAAALKAPGTASNGIEAREVVQLLQSSPQISEKTLQILSKFSANFFKSMNPSN